MTNESPNPAPQFFPSPQPATPQPSGFWNTAPVIGQGGTPEQAQAFAAERVRLGQMTPEAASESLKAAGQEPAPQDNRSDAAKDFDASFASAPATAIKIDFQGRLPAGTDPRTVGEFNTVATEWASELGLPASIAGSVVERALEVGQSVSQMTPTQQALWAAEQRVIFDRVAGSPERAAALRAHAATVLASASKRADFSNALLERAGSRDAICLMNLALHGERLQLRSKL